MMRLNLLTFGLLGSIPLFAMADERVEDSFIPNYAVGNTYFTWTGDADFTDVPGSVSQQEFGFEANVPVIMRDSYRLTAGVQYRQNNLKFTGAPFPFGSTTLDLYRVDVPFNFWKDINQKWKLWVSLRPGWYSDFENVNSDDFILTSLALFSYQWTDTTKLAFGAFYSRDLGEERVLPAIGVIYEPDQHWSLAVTFPRLQAVYAPNEDWLFTGRGVLNGSGWNIANPAGAGPDVQLEYSAIQAGFGIDRRISGPWWAYVDGGVQFGQEIKLEGAVPFEQDLDSAAFVSAGIKVRF